VNSEQRLVDSGQWSVVSDQGAVDSSKNNNSLFTNHCPLSTIIDLQWFADDDEDAPGKIEQPTPEKLRRLREDEGQVIKSQEVTGAIGLLFPALFILFFAPWILRNCVELIRFFFLRVNELDPTRDAIIVGNFFIYFIRLAVPILAVAVFAAIFSNMVQLVAQQGGILFNTKPLMPKFSKAIPRLGQYFKRIFSSEGGFNLIKSIAKILIIGGVSFLFIRSDIEILLNLQKSDPYTALVLVGSIAIRIMLVVALIWIILSIGDYFFQRWRFHERHKMTRYEVKEERKMLDADPMIQGRIRSRFREMLKKNMPMAVQSADVVITNPTHFAVALQFKQGSMEGPMVMAKGADSISARIREIAREHGVPLVENKPLARALYQETDVGDIIPIKYWKIVADILIKVWRLDEKHLEKIRMSA
jgi:flagellar biosynthetic protein FlhB